MEGVEKETESYSDKQYGDNSSKPNRDKKADISLLPSYPMPPSKVEANKTEISELLQYKSVCLTRILSKLEMLLKWGKNPVVQTLAKKPRNSKSPRYLNLKVS